ncbi:mycofactocin-coupled SDR family oxidoreductase [Patulibacter sp.]|uniref:mycofactocin-coupled SDR family oxidoreductase n=1 Tax=Patulibacter sp. TaxID=1912859 RepID=UPI002718A73D|nr:mycofactocin-coupled SDR family oxidoreductase [Patulibacter sp.]MDO9410833.1 mycofactocin-coupled SDR family oxidoreductase [Patulibacter sp.]
MGDLEGQVAFITGAARGQGRNHAVRLAERGVDIVALDVNRTIDTVSYPGPDADDLAETVRLVEATGRRIVAREADVRDADAVRGVLAEGIDAFGRLDIVIPNAGIASVSSAREMSDAMWHELIDINLNGTWHAIAASLPHMGTSSPGGRGGSIVLIGSVASFKGMANIVHYVATKHAMVGIAKSLALELGPDHIRVNVICPTNVDTPMVQNAFTRKLFMPDVENPTREDAEREGSPHRQANAIPIPWIDCDDTTNAMLFLVSDTGRYVTGTAIPVDAGFLTK